MPGDILDLIDSALEDWSVSDDAMRSNPGLGRVICDGGKLWPERWSTLRHGSYGITVGPVFHDSVFSGCVAANVVAYGADPSGATDSTAAIQAALNAASAPRETIVGPSEWTATFTFEPVPQWITIGPAGRADGMDEWVVIPVQGDGVRQQIADAFGFTWKRGALHYHAADAPPRALRRCALCNPRTGPRKLPIDGHAYSRRRAARKRSGR